MSQSSYRLPRNIVPVGYEIDINASPRRQSFEGKVEMTAKVVEPTQVLELNARNMRFSKVTAQINNRWQQGVVKHHKDRETIEITFPRMLPKGKFVARFEYKGKLSKNMHGLYLAKDGPEKAIVSQCEATDARAIFPCFDEPDLKATLRWIIRTDPSLEVITNGVLESRRRSHGLLVHRFKATRVISTYLAAVTIGPYEATKPQRVKGIPCRVVCGQGKLEQTRFAEAITQQVLPWYQDYFGQKYNYQKLDQVAVPGFDAGAMENVGAIFYRQNLLLMDEKATSWAAQKRIAEVIAHEIAHQWFGNLVTMKWWDDLWLNEAFATWIAFKAVDVWKPHWRMWDDYLFAKEAALSADSLHSTHPIYTHVESPAQATELFDVITYEKGCAILRMTESYVGEEKFRQGIRDYQSEFKNKNATGADLWAAVEGASKQPVTELMTNWIQQSGFPVVSVSMPTPDNKVRIYLEQKRFFANANEMQIDNDQTWSIPIQIRYGQGNKVQTKRIIFSDRNMEIELPKDTQWIYPNADATGFFRINFDERALAGLVNYGLPQLSPAERMSLLEDQWALVRSGLSNIDQFMGVVSAFREETDYVVLQTLYQRMSYLEQRLVQTDDRDAFREFICWMFKQQLHLLGDTPKEGESPAESVQRATLVRALGELGRDPETLERAQKFAEQELAEPTRVEPNLAGVCVNLAALTGDVQKFEQFLKEYGNRKKRGDAPELQLRYLHAFGYFESNKAVTQLLQTCLTDAVPQEQLRSVLVPLLSRRDSQKETWRFLQSEWQEIAPRVGAMAIARLVEATGALPVASRNSIEKFFKDNAVPEAQRAVKKSLEAIDIKAELVQREGDRLARWLQRGPNQLAKVG